MIIKIDKEQRIKKATGREYALLTHKCPLKHDVGIEPNICFDCPDDCPLQKDSLRIINGEIVGRNNPQNHPEDFLDGYDSMYPKDHYELEYGVTEPNWGYYFTKEPKHWKEYVEYINELVRSRVDDKKD